MRIDIQTIQSADVLESPSLTRRVFYLSDCCSLKPEKMLIISIYMRKLKINPRGVYN